MDEEVFLKSDEGKLRYDLIPPESLAELAAVLTYGAQKYEADNWKNCKDSGRIYASLIRHLQAYRLGEIVDKESGLSHLSHAMANVVFLSRLEETIDE